MGFISDKLGRRAMRADSDPTSTAPRDRADAATATAGEVAYRRIRSDIVVGRLAPGRKLTLERMREAYGTSVNTLREHLSRLASEGLVVAEGSRGFHVSGISADNLREVAAMRELLEGHALRLSFERGDIEWEGGVVAAHHKLASIEQRMAAGRQPDPKEWRHYDWAFHAALIAACGSTVLLDTHAAIRDRYLRYQMIAAIYRGRVASDEHAALRDCALARDWRRAQRVLAAHIADCVAQMIDELPHVAEARGRRPAT
jgi:DNA-binding GntR family transcriptional regulator